MTAAAEIILSVFAALFVVVFFGGVVSGLMMYFGWGRAVGEDFPPI